MLKREELKKIYFPEFDEGIRFKSPKEERDSYLTFIDLLLLLLFNEQREENESVFKRSGLKFKDSDIVSVLSPDKDQETELNGLRDYLSALKRSFPTAGGFQSFYTVLPERERPWRHRYFQRSLGWIFTV